MKLQWRRVTNTEPPADDRAYRVTQSLDDSTLFVRRGKEIWFLRQQVENNSGWNWYAGPIPEPLPPEPELELPEGWQKYFEGDSGFGKCKIAVKQTSPTYSAVIIERV